MAKKGPISLLYPLLLCTLVFNCQCQERKKTQECARLTEEEAVRLSKMDGVVSVFPNRNFKLHTTRSWDFMGFSQNRLVGIWPEHESFNDNDFGPAPAKWKGRCTGANFTCNNKLIGACYYNSEGVYAPTDIKSPRDTEGHGSHTSSITTGREIQGASYYGIAEGTARGGVPKGRVAMYKVCWKSGCYAADILKAFDDAISDGVDIISVSLGYESALAYFQDTIAIGSFHAMKCGILTSCAAGNSGPYPITASNIAPWMLTVAASTIDRKFISQVVLGNGKVLNGLSVNAFDLNGVSYPLIWGRDAANYSAGQSADMASYCLGPLNSHKVAGKIVFCGSITSGANIILAKGVGAIVAGTTTDVAFTYPLPLTQISNEDAQIVINYIRTTENVMAPTVASFSSRGPNALSPDILRPDITAPGVDILAAWSPIAPATGYPDDKRSLLYNVISGTSMSTPHASGAAAFIKAAHPNWSPAAIKSSLMTSAYIMDSDRHVDQEFSYGAGHINPIGALSPGLIYDASEQDYVDFLCKQGYNATLLKLVTGDNSTCDNILPGRGWDLNYPSFALYVEDGQPINAVFTRTVTNVGSPSVTYKSTVYLWGAATNVTVTVHPSTLSFSATGETKSFSVVVTWPRISQQPIMSGAIVWENGDQVIRSPIVIYNFIPGAPYYNLVRDEVTT